MEMKKLLIVAAFILCAICLFACTPDENKKPEPINWKETELNGPYSFDDEGDPSREVPPQPPWKCTYYAPTSEFNVNDVELKFTYSIMGADNPTHILVKFSFVTKNVEGAWVEHLIRESNEIATAEKYSPANGSKGFSENIVVPKSLFLSNFGRIYFEIDCILVGEDPDGNTVHEPMQIGTGFFYALDGETVYLSNKEITEI
jgi:hypothetical protein